MNKQIKIFKNLVKCYIGNELKEITPIEFIMKYYPYQLTEEEIKNLLKDK